MKPVLVPLAALAVLGGCSEPNTSGNAAAPAETAAPQQGPAESAARSAAPLATFALAVEGEGLRLFNRATGSARPLPFGTARTEVMTALAFRGAPGLAHLEECGAGPLDQAAWPDGLALYFQDGRFAGWALDARGNDGTNPPAITTAAGIGPGSTRAELESAYAIEVMRSTLGTEFTAGGLAGLLDGTGARARITHLWAGASCAMR